MLLTTSDQFFQALTTLAKRFDHGIITSFGVFASIGFNGDISNQFPSAEHTFLKTVADHPDLSMIVGIHNYYSPQPSYIDGGNCRHCLSAHARRVLRIETHRELFPNIKWRLLRGLHSKVAVFWSDNMTMAIIGSRNFTNSQSIEVAMLTQDAAQTENLKNYVIDLRDQSTEVELGSLINYLIEDTGSDYCVQMVCGSA